MSRSLQIWLVGVLAIACFLVIAGYVVFRRMAPPIAEANSGSVDLTQVEPTNASQADSASTATPIATAMIAPREELDLLPAVKERRYDAAIKDIVDREDPVVDGWDTERFSELTDKQLKAIGKMLSDATLIDEKHVAKIGVKDCDASIRPQQLSQTFDDPSFRVQRAADPDGKLKTQPQLGLLESLKWQASAFGPGERRFKFKTVRVELNDSTAKTRSLFQMSSLGRPSVQVNSTWDCTWTRTGDHPRLTSIVVSKYEEVQSQRNDRFVDVTRALFAGNDSLEQQFIYGRDHWYGNLEASIGVEGRGNGISIGDANGDGLDDVYICQPAALPNKLFLRQPDGSLKDVSKQAGVDWLDSSRGALFVDIDNDGDQDLVLTQSSQVLIHENDGQGLFELKNAISTISRLFSINAIDFDNDSDLDLYVCGYSGTQQIRPEDIFASPVPYHDANNGAPNLLLRNDGGWQFTNVTEAVGLDQNNLRFSLASFWDDFDNDGDFDVYVANDFGRNNLYQNNSGHFVDIAHSAGVEDIGPGMSACSGDYNNDGLPDIYVSNMFSSAGSRITHNSQFKPGAEAEDLSGFQRHARGNSLFENRGDGGFSDLGVESGTMMGRWAWGSLLVDINNDGWRDAYVTNGFVTADDNNDL